MGVILDSSILIAGERRRDSVDEVLERVAQVCGETFAAISAITAVELTHGIYRAKTDADRLRRQTFVDEVFLTVAVYSLTLDVARLAGRVHGEQMALGNSIDFSDMLIGATALHLDFAVATLNARHFQAIPGLQVFRV